MQNEYIDGDFTPNEVTELAMRAKSDETYMLPLWKAVRRFVGKMAAPYMHGGTARLYDADDLLQQGYIALSEAVRTYEPKGMQFVGWLSFYLARAFNAVAGQKNDAIRYTCETVVEDKSGDEKDLFELIEDESAEKALSAIERSDAAKFLVRQIKALPERVQSECILAVAAGEKRRHIAERLQISYNDVKRHFNRAQMLLQHNKHIMAAYPEYYRVYTFKSVSAFNTSWSSVVEDAAIRREEIRERMKRYAEKQKKIEMFRIPARTD